MHDGEMNATFKVASNQKFIHKSLDFDQLIKLTCKTQRKQWLSPFNHLRLRDTLIQILLVNSLILTLTTLS